MNKYVLLLILSSFSGECYGMQTHAYFLDLFKQEPVPTEYTAYTLLTQNPLPVPINYLAVPWTVLINKKMLNKLPRIKLKGGFTVCQHIWFEPILPLLKEIGITVLFSPHVEKSKQYNGITVLPFPHIQKYGVDPATTKNIYYSFIGFYSHACRGSLFAMNHSKGCVVKRRYNWHFWFDSKKQESFSREYMDVLSRSRFSLCPRGTGASTIRFWESLQAGAIPVLISDEMMLPDWIDWDSVIVRIAEKEVSRIPSILSGITTEQERTMRKRCLEIHRQFSGDHFVSTIRQFYQKNS